MYKYAMKQFLKSMLRFEKHSVLTEKLSILNSSQVRQHNKYSRAIQQSRGSRSPDKNSLAIAYPSRKLAQQRAIVPDVRFEYNWSC